MSEPLSAWHADHIKFAKLLELLEHQLVAFGLGERPDYGMMLDIVAYLRDFGDRFHHPREDAAFARLIQHDPMLRMPIARRLQEHRVIAAAGEELAECLQALTEDAVVERSRVETALATYLVYYRYHMTAEEEQLIPAATAKLTAADWAAVGDAAPTAGGEQRNFDARYRDLLVRIEPAAQKP
ncbi:MAG TPA: hemerythrin domain-containing protein [Burkholderiaceae bacterium]|nr:hemerythrin domain-containing protein [Burkholderiaceae bacterium]